MFIGDHEAFIGVKIYSVISSEDFTHFKVEYEIPLYTSSYKAQVYTESNPQAP